MALPEELDQRLEQRLALVETPEYEGEQMDRRDYVSVLLLCARVGWARRTRPSVRHPPRPGAALVLRSA